MNEALSEPRDRFNALQQSDALNGVDYVEVVAGHPDELRVHFLNSVQPLAELAASITGGDTVPVVTVAPVDPAHDWSVDPAGRPLLVLHLPDGPGDFSTYTLSLAAATSGQNSGLDRYFAAVTFSFKALCPSDFDCAPPPHVCPPEQIPVPAIDYTAKDFGSFVQALQAFSAQKYPNWQERSEADLGMVVMEALSALADEFSYYQDRVAAEAAIGTATQRHSLVSLARLVDYEPAPTRSAVTTLMCTVAAAGIPAGVAVAATGADGGLIVFEIGNGLNDQSIYPVSASVNFPIAAYFWDDSERCLEAGATEIWVRGGSLGFAAGMGMLIQTDLPGESLRQVVTITEVESAFDLLYPGGGVKTPVTRIAWGVVDALTAERNLLYTNVGGNLLPATQGQRTTEAFAIATAPGPGIPLAIARRGPNATDAVPNYVYRRPLRQSPIAWLAPPASSITSPLVAANALAPEIDLQRIAPSQDGWTFATTLLNAGPLETAFTIDPVAWRAVATNPDGSIANYEMDGDGGESIRFGDDVFGRKPDAGDVFSVTYRIGRGASGNVPADSVTLVDPGWSAFLLAASNPFAASGGADAETAQHIRNIAPYQFQATQFRAVRPEDYVEAAQTLPWVYRAGSAFRWTGSWLSVFTVADPRGTDVTSPAQNLSLVEILNRRRLAGYESFAPPPVYVSLDLIVEICVGADAVGPEVEGQVLAGLSAGGASSSAFFFADRFTFGTPLYRSALEAAVQAVPGVNGVLSILYRRRGVTTGWRDLPEVFPLGADRILRIENNPDYPERGTLKIVAEGGR